MLLADVGGKILSLAVIHIAQGSLMLKFLLRRLQNYSLRADSEEKVSGGVYWVWLCVGLVKEYSLVEGY